MNPTISKAIFGIGVGLAIASVISIYITMKVTQNQGIVSPSNNTSNGATTKSVSIVSGASSMADKAFSPNPVDVKVGDTVTWTNDDSQPHTVTSGKDSSDPDKGKVFDSSPNFNPMLSPKQTFQHKFTTAGDVPYFCQIHPNMVGKVVVS